MKLFENLSLREKNLWGELLVDVLVAAFYFPKAIALMAQGDDMLRGRDMAGLVVSTIVLAIIVSIVVFAVINKGGEVEEKDERDRRFEARGNLVGYWSLNALLIAILVYIASTEYTPAQRLSSQLLELGPLGVGHLILLALVLTSVIKASTQLYQYRRSV